jgi:1-acyl-sn-glycerol-3-phosphate acyltransferase
MGIWPMSIQSLKAPIKLIRAVLHLLHGVWIIKTQFSFITQLAREEQVKTWSANLIAILGIELRVIGQPLAHGLLAANHISWLDILAIHAAHFCRFIAKADIKKWPVIGFLTDQSGMLFIERTRRRDAHRVVGDVASCLALGDCVAVFPEGTTSDGRTLLPFHANMIQSAIDAKVSVQPVALSFIDARSGEQSFAPCYVGDESLLKSVWRTLCSPRIAVVVRFGEPLVASGKERRQLADDLRGVIHTMLKC